jgi:thiol-disulfide isomerase/thioredoxin
MPAASFAYSLSVSSVSVIRRFAELGTCCLVLAVAGIGLPSGFAAEDEGAAETDAPPKVAQAYDELFQIPAEAKPEEILDFLDELKLKRIRPKTRDELVQFLVRVHETIIAESAKLVAEPTTEDVLLERALELHLDSHTLLASSGLPGMLDNSLKSITKLSKDKRPTVAQTAQERLEILQILAVGQLSAADRDALIAEVLKSIVSTDYSESALQKAFQLGSQLEELESSESAVQFYSDFADALEKSSRTEIQEGAEQMRGIARRLNLPGNSIEVVGTDLDGKPFDLTDLKGKVVLVDFWATWCGPCVAEMPNVMRLYKGYHEKGFEVIGISLDEEREKLDKFVAKRKLPWRNLFETDPKLQGWSNPVARKYGISGIPTAILVDQEGKVVSVLARGRNLAAMLEQLLGPVELPEETEQPGAEAEEMEAE